MTLRAAAGTAILSLMDKHLSDPSEEDRVFAALADPTRRAVVQRLGTGPGSVSELARGFPIALPSFMKHLRVLEASGLIRTRKSGRVRSCELNRARLELVGDWLDAQRRSWEARGDRLQAFAEAEAALAHVGAAVPADPTPDPAEERP